MAYKITKSERKKTEKSAYYTLCSAYYQLDYEAGKQGWDSYGEAPLKEREKILKIVAKKYPYTYGK
jgi:hypothetical protein